MNTVAGRVPRDVAFGLENGCLCDGIGSVADLSTDGYLPLPSCKTYVPLHGI